MTDAARTSVLVVEDEPLIQIYYADLLRESEFRVCASFACNGKVVDWLDTHRPDLAIVDYGLPDGPCRPIVARLQELGIPFLIVSAFPLSSTDALRQQPWLAKPFLEMALMAAIRALPAQVPLAAPEPIEHLLAACPMPSAAPTETPAA